MKNFTFLMICSLLMLVLSCKSNSRYQVKHLGEKYSAIKILSKKSIKPLDRNQVIELLPFTKNLVDFGAGNLFEECKIGENRYSVLVTYSKTLGSNVWIKEISNQQNEFILLHVKNKFKYGKLCTARSVCLNAIMRDRNITVDISFCLKTTVPAIDCELFISSQIQCQKDSDCR